MQVIIVKADTAVAAAHCRKCENLARAGEVVLYDRLATNDFADPSYVVHVDCLKAVLVNAPEGQVPVNAAAQIQRLREQAIAAGAS